MAYTTIDKPTDYFETVIWTGNGSARDITVSHGTNWIWGKRRNGTNAHWLMDTVRGVDKRLISSGTDAEDDPSTAILTAFNSNGFSLGTNSECNLNGATYVGWSWKESATAGFDIVSYTGNGSAYSETPFGAEDSSVIVYPLGIQLTAQENSGIINIDVDVSVTGQALTAAARNCSIGSSP